MSYTVLARKYRPQTFAELVGQEHVARTLANAIASERVAHAFLFTGVRGVGKTTTARLLAKSLNCESGPTDTPCNACVACIAITAGNDIDVQEIDGASNNSVDDVRRLQETLPFRPSRDRYKIVIVDEVHMLSSGAFNAFLKTLEEPPEHVKFIFATTESHKVPVTIRSRCQQYDFRLISQREIAQRVRAILGKEGIEADDETVAIVAREAAGSMRDALTLLDQLVALCGTKLVGSHASKSLGIAARSAVFDVARAVLEGDAAAVLASIHALSEQGADMLHFAKQLLELVRDLVVLSISPEEGSVSLVEEERTKALELATTIESLELQRAFSAFSKVVEEVGTASSPRMALEMGLVRVATRPPLRSIHELLNRIDTIARQGASSPLVASKAAPLPPKAAPPAKVATPTAAPRESRSSRPSSSDEKASKDEPSGVDPAERLERWREIVVALQASRPALAAILEHATPIEVGSARIVIGFPKDSFFGQQAQAIEAREQLAAGAAEVLGQVPQVEVVADAGGGTATLAAEDRERKKVVREKRRDQALRHPSVRDAIKIFPEGASSVEVHIDGD